MVCHLRRLMMHIIELNLLTQKLLLHMQSARPFPETTSILFWRPHMLEIIEGLIFWKVYLFVGLLFVTDHLSVLPRTTNSVQIGSNLNIVEHDLLKLETFFWLFGAQLLLWNIFLLWSCIVRIVVIFILIVLNLLLYRFFPLLLGNLDYLFEGLFRIFTYLLWIEPSCWLLLSISFPFFFWQFND